MANNFKKPIEKLRDGDHFAYNGEFYMKISREYLDPLWFYAVTSYGRLLRLREGTVVEQQFTHFISMPH